MDAEIKEIKQDVREIKQSIMENTVVLAKNTEQLSIHIQASKDLHERLVPIEDHVNFQRRLAKWFSWAVGLGAGVAAIIHYL